MFIHHIDDRLIPGDMFFLPGEPVSNITRMAHDTEIPQKVPGVQLTFVTFSISIGPTPLNKTMGP